MTAEYILIVSFCTAMRGLPVECVEAYQAAEPFASDVDCKRASMHHRQDHTDALRKLNHSNLVSVQANCKWESGNGK